VGVAAIQQKLDDAAAALEPVALMEQALRAAADDAGCPALLARAGEILVPNSLWSYADPGRLLAGALGASTATTLLAEFGVSQQHLLDRACQRIVDGEIEVALVTGGEARYRALRAGKAGLEASEIDQDGAEPDLKLLPGEELWTTVESDAGLGMPVGYYAIMDSALRYASGQTLDAHRDEMAAMYARFSEIAADNPAAWSDEPVSAAHIREPSATNRMLAFPYTKLHNTQWNVDQAAGLILCSAAAAEELGIAREKWVFPLASTESNFISVVAARRDLGACPGFRLAGKAAQELSGINFNDVRFCELYSCFPFAVRVQLQEFGMNAARDLSVTGGMAFGGGPLNNFVFQSTARMAQLLRENPSEVGLVSTVSGMLTKQGCALWSTEPGANGWAFADVTEQVRESSEVCELVADYSGPATVAGYTVLFQGMEPWRAVAVFDLPDGRRTVAYSEQAQHMERMMSEECCGLGYQLSAGQFGDA
jgi:acetyl-CoA C-acetyltransferase